MRLASNAPSPQISVAILTMSDPERTFRGNMNNFIDLIRTGKEMGAFIYVATIDDLKPERKRIYGYVHHPESGMWIRQLLPLPQVIYSRIPNRKDEQQPEVQAVIRSILKKKSPALFNPYFFNKWTLYEWLDRSKATRRFIPATRKLSTPEDLAAFMGKHPTIYLKPIRGKAGTGIMKLEKGSKRDRFWCRLHLQEKEKSVTSKHYNLIQLWTQIKQETFGEEYIMQQGIPLARVDNRPFDLRVLVQKNGKGIWSLSGIGARVAGRKSITTHVPRGGYIDSPENALISVFGEEKSPQLLKKVKKSSLYLARHIERESGVPLGEMSMDLGVDSNGRIWFFEANSRPMKFDEPEIRTKSLESIVNYCLYLGKSGVRNKVKST
ncbi:YheC/YheD family protein [Gorillibacterium massiliense]|uniref:YheC/YheD family endospore coat-associated protein n=1 Tax=Gorillibacterium massiliense TaxID=1280390 RepID=UPI0004AF4777|nr:YheC/YheD family protein [Gorillibacterium massiliense]